MNSRMMAPTGYGRYEGRREHMMKRQKPANFKADVGVVLEGEQGESAYEIAVRQGFIGTEQEWLDSLKGEATKAEQYTKEAMAYRDSSKSYATQSGNSAVEAKAYRDETQRLKDSIYPEAESALTRIIAAKSEVEAIENQTRQYAEDANASRVQADADAVEVRYLYEQTVIQKNVATDAAERARRYAEGEHWQDYYRKEETDARIIAATSAESSRAITVEAGLSGDIASLSDTVDGNYTSLVDKINTDLLNYYKKAETYTKTEVDGMVSAIPKYGTIVVDELPENVKLDKIYLVRTGSDSGNLFTEYILVKDDETGEYRWEQLGTQKLDLSGYMTKDGLFTVSISKPTDMTVWIKPIGG